MQRQNKENSVTFIDFLKPIYNELDIRKVQAKLFQRKLISYTTILSFVQYIRQVLFDIKKAELSIFLKYFKQDYQSYLNQYGTDKILVIPIPFQQNYQIYISRMYIEQYIKQRKAKVPKNARQDNSQKYFLYKQNFAQEVISLSKKQEQLGKKQQNQIEQKSHEQIIFNNYWEGRQSQKIQQIVPEFFYSLNGYVRLSARRMLSIDLTDVCQPELSEVKANISTQFNSNKYIQSNFSIFLSHYRYFFYLISGQSQKNQNFKSQLDASFQNFNNSIDKRHKQVRHCPQISQSIFLKNWRIMHQNLLYKLAQEKIDPATICKQVIECLYDHKIYIIFSPRYIADKLYSQTFGKTIVINVTHAPIQCNLLMRFIKYSELYIVSSQLPQFFLSPGCNKFESGYQIERRLFPTIPISQAIYEKDYETIKLISEANASKVGVVPSDLAQKGIHVRLANSNKFEAQPKMGTGILYCRRHNRNYSENSSHLQLRRIERKDMKKNQLNIND